MLHTIVAIITPIGKSGVGIIRISGSLVKLIIKKMFFKKLRHRYAEYVPFYNKDKVLVDYGIVLFFSRPFSFTGEDVLELHTHGNPVILQTLLNYLLTFDNVRLANPGEFSERAFINGKIDLSQAESIIDLINAESIQDISLINRSLSGIYSKYINKIKSYIYNLYVKIEAYLNFEEVTSLNYKKIRRKIFIVIDNIKKIIVQTKHNNFVLKRIKLVIAGEPNVGKSSLFNLLVGSEASIITSIPGTTRNILYRDIIIEDILFTVVDTAGLNFFSQDKIECLGVKKAVDEIFHADFIFFIVDAQYFSILSIRSLLKKKIMLLFPKESSIVIIRNKSDLTNENFFICNLYNYKIITLSLQKFSSLFILKKILLQKYKIDTNNINDIFYIKERHLVIFEKVLKILKKSINILCVENNIEILAENLILVQKYFAKITGEIYSNTVLKDIFSKFCIGK